MVTFSINESKVPYEYLVDLWETIIRLKRYFCRYNQGVPVEQVMMEAWNLGVVNYNEEFKGRCLDPYVKALARTIMSNGGSREIPFSPVDEETGEVSYVFNQETECMGYNIELDIQQKVMDRLADLYLEYPDTMMEIKPFIFSDKIEGKIKPLKVANKEVYNELIAICQLLNEDGYTLFALLRQFYNDVEKQRKKSVQLTDNIKEIQIKPITYDDVVRLPNEYTIVFCGNNKYSGIRAGIDKKALTMTEEINLDLCKWKPINMKSGVLRYDISGIMDYLSENIFVEEGVNTNHIQWVGNKYKLTSFGGFTQLNVDKFKFLEYCQRELVMSFVHNNINNIIAFSDDNIYVQPTRKLGYRTLKCEGYRGKVIDVPVEVYAF